ncbi:MAG: hypothetical protein DHS20C11_17220 [Lysobacteraceae bacterium]|nr:MAG: hypothetical protein DHS20C11_17220 [Xanthomonadaceae bacterium]
MRYKNDPDGTRLPIKLDSTSNGEYAPIPLQPIHHKANDHALKEADRRARYKGQGRRDFLVSACGAASTLLAFNQANASAGRDGGFHQVSDEAAVDTDAALQALGKNEFIFDVQGHYLPPGGHMQKKAGCAEASEALSGDYMACIGAESFKKDVFLDSDTDMMVLSFVPSTPESEPLTIEEADATRQLIDDMNSRHRLLLHGRVNPNQPADIAAMDELAERWGVSAWKCYTQWGPDGEGFYLSDDVGRAFIEKARSLGVKNIAVHKGIPFGQKSYEHSLCTDIGVVARDYPDVNFLIYHSGWVPGQAEGPYDPDRGEGIDGLIKSVKDNGLGHHSNVYAELGSTWRGLMRDPDSAAHTLGKLITHLGEDNILWGTDSVWYGSPQDQILAFRTFQLSAELRDKHGYAEITPEIRAKIFGLNAMKPYGIDIDEVKRRAANDVLARDRLAYTERQDPHFLTYGPKTRRQFLDLLKIHPPV